MDLITLTQALIKKQSITPKDAGCQELIADYLSKLGFEVTHLPFGETKNLWAYLQSTNNTDINTKTPLFVFAGHTDVVPTGKLSQWTHPPFEAKITNDGKLHGRGSVDMKSGLAAMLASTKNFLDQQKKQNQNIHFDLAFLITSDEEGPALDGTQKVCEWLKQNNIKPDYCLVGEPSSIEQTGDQIRIGRRGSLSGKLIIHGKQGHVAYPEKAINAISIASEIINKLNNTTWDNGNKNFPATSLQFTKVKPSTDTSNIIPGEVLLEFNLRFSPEVTVDNLKNKVNNLIKNIYENFKITWRHSGDPFYTQPSHSTLIKITQQAISKITNKQTILSTGGGTSDGRFIAKLHPNIEVIELGLPNKTIHAIDEHCEIKQLESLTLIYQEILSTI